ncbi:hypothetical protein M422DRAFT_268373 [Sphaerobolus stellatus SS14]|uniref:Uncharacterized protein n=1 Tax=Sphaerobolus stellatus (strain SS14) TaxID=990650 RepID=A0A0C9UYB9_SPHS4|nr:hypothetical protein M422DRAFT_268373 [Sphaerobolus stellatus SS14]
MTLQRGSHRPIVGVLGGLFLLSVFLRFLWLWRRLRYQRSSRISSDEIQGRPCNIANGGIKPFPVNQAKIAGVPDMLGDGPSASHLPRPISNSAHADSPGAGTDGQIELRSRSEADSRVYDIQETSDVL